MARFPDLTRGDLDVVRIGGLDRFEARFDDLHFVQVFDRAFFAGGDDQPVLAGLERHFRRKGRQLGICFARLNVNESAQAMPGRWGIG